MQAIQLIDLYLYIILVMDGILVIDKPAGITSHDVVARVRRILKIKRVGHTGTLDPFATGVMVILVGKATRLAQFLDKDVKEYEAVVKFGSETDTGDRTGVRIAECGSRIEDVSAFLNMVTWAEILSEFRGDIEQVPPMYSAKKIEGEKLYELARKGVEVERKPSRVTIYELDIPDAQQIHTPQPALRIRVVCSAGTYIRTLAVDIGRKLGLGAYLDELRRTRAGRFDLSRAVSLDELDARSDPASLLIPMQEAVAHLPEVILSDERIERTRNGLSSRYPVADLPDGQPVRMTGGDGSLIAIGVYNETEKTVRPKVVLV